MRISNRSQPSLAVVKSRVSSTFASRIKLQTSANTKMGKLIEQVPWPGQPIGSWLLNETPLQEKCVVVPTKLLRAILVNLEVHYKSANRWKVVLLVSSWEHLWTAVRSPRINHKYFMYQYTYQPAHLEEDCRLLVFNRQGSVASQIYWVIQYIFLVVRIVASASLKKRRQLK
jgi:hypothetical protein